MWAGVFDFDLTEFMLHWAWYSFVFHFVYLLRRDMVFVT